MYKVFVNDRLICLTNNEELLKNDEESIFFNDISSDTIQQALSLVYQADSGPKINFVIPELEVGLEIFKSHFEFINASGGVVRNKKNEMLVIHRLGKWDLPKGKLEGNETSREGALREVEEECAVDQLEINKMLTSTYHIYQFKGNNVLKQTDWYTMTTHFEGRLMPQTEEDIDKVCWFTDDEVREKLFKDTYSSIRELLKSIGY